MLKTKYYYIFVISFISIQNCLSFCTWMTMSRRWIYVKLSINIFGHTQWVGLGILMMIIIIKKNGTCYRGFFIQNMIWMKPKEWFSQHSSLHFLSHVYIDDLFFKPTERYHWIHTFWWGTVVTHFFVCVHSSIQNTISLKIFLHLGCKAHHTNYGKICLRILMVLRII